MTCAELIVDRKSNVPTLVCKWLGLISFIKLEIIDLTNLERRDALACRGIPDLDSAIKSRRREPLCIGRPGDGIDGSAMALERRDAGIPFIIHNGVCENPFWLLHSKLISYYTTGRAEYKRGCVDLKGVILDCPLNYGIE